MRNIGRHFYLQRRLLTLAGLLAFGPKNPEDGHLLDEKYSEGVRIRHGTLHGVLVTELKESVDAIVDQFALSYPEFSGFVRRWYSQVEAAVKVFGLELLRVRSSERKSDLIIPTIGDGDKRSTAQNMLNSVAMGTVGHWPSFPEYGPSSRMTFDARLSDFP